MFFKLHVHPHFSSKLDAQNITQGARSACQSLPEFMWMLASLCLILIDSLSDQSGGDMNLPIASIRNPNVKLRTTSTMIYIQHCG